MIQFKVSSFATCLALCVLLTTFRVEANAPTAWNPTVLDVVKLVYCVIGSGSCDGLAPASTVDITSDNAGVCTAAGGTWADGACVAAPLVTSNDQVICTTAGGIWTNSNTCRPTPDCFQMGLCGQHGAAALGISGPYSADALADAMAVGTACVDAYQDGAFEADQWNATSLALLCTEEP